MLEERWGGWTEDHGGRGGNTVPTSTLNNPRRTLSKYLQL